MVHGSTFGRPYRPSPASARRRASGRDHRCGRGVTGLGGGVVTTRSRRSGGVAFDFDVASACVLAAGQSHGPQVIVTVPGLHG